MDGTNAGTELVYEGAAVDAFENRLAFTGDPGADTTVTIPNVTGTIITSGDTGTVTGTMVDESTLVLDGLIDDNDIAAGAVDGGAAGEIADNTITSDDIGADAVGASELAATAVTAGSYTVASITVDADGRLTAASSGAARLPRIRYPP